MAHASDRTRKTEKRRETRPGVRETRQNGLWINYDAAIGLYNIGAAPGVINPDNLSTVSFTPGIEAEFPVSDRWTLRSYANLGWGTAMGDGDSAWIWYAGIKSR